MFKPFLFALAFAAVIPMSAHASDSAYSYVELGVDSTDYGQGENVRSDGTLSGSFAITDKFYVAGTFHQADRHFGGTFFPGLEFRVDENYEYWVLNFGYHQNLGEKNDLIAEIGYESDSYGSSLFFNDALASEGGVVNKNLQAAVGLRTSFGNHWETLAKLHIRDNHADSVESRLVAELGGMYKFNPTWALTLNTQTNSSGISSYGLGVRANFGVK